MKLTPLEIKQQQFEKSLRGYDVADVQSFLTLVSNEYEHLLTKNKELEDQIEKLGDRVRHYERVEEALHETLQTTKESVAQKMDNARLEAKNATDKAQMEADAIVSEANQQRAQIRQSILRLVDKRDEIIAGITSYLGNALSSVEKFSADEMGIFALPTESTPEVSIADVETEEEATNNSRFALDEENLTEEESELKTTFNEEDNGFSHEADRLNDILDEID